MAEVKSKIKSLGRIQASVLSSLIEHKGWEEMCGWSYDTQTRTKKVLDSLVAHRFVCCENGHYTPVLDANGNVVKI